MADYENPEVEEVAVIGMAGRFPGADSVDALWKNIVNGVCSLKRFTVSEYQELGYSEDDYKKDNFIPALGYLEDADCFDESFFSYSPNEAKSIDPQQRIFLEVSWQALHDAGINPFEYEGLIGVFAGAGYNYANAHDLLKSDKAAIDKVDMMNFIGNEKDFLSTRVAYKLNLRGPSYTVLSACSSSLLAVHQGVQNLLTYQCDAALCGGVSLQQPKIPGYYYNKGEIFSPSGVVRTFDEAANGTVLGEGCGIVVLKRLSEAVKDGDNIYAVIKASAANNDGANKAGYTAPSIQGQRDVIQYALDLANLDPQDISYIEAHGTGTSLGDLIEFSALKEVFKNSPAQQKCALGAIKSNIGHLDVAAGVTGLIKTCLALKNKQIPRQINVEKVNSKFDIENSPFFIPQETDRWMTSAEKKRKAGVSSFGIGGTNVHIVLEEAPSTLPFQSETESPGVFLPVSSHSSETLVDQLQTLSTALQEKTVLPEEAAYTLINSWNDGKYRSGLVCTEEINPIHSTPSGIKPCKDIKDIVFLFPGQGSQYDRMGESLYRSNDSFKQSLDRIAAIVLQKAGFDIRKIIFEQLQVDGRDLNSTSITQICLFAIEYALYESLVSIGVVPTKLVGHSLGEITAAAVGGIFSLEDAIDFVLVRGECMEQGPSGAMVAVLTSAENVAKYCSDSIFLAVENGPMQSVLSCADDMLDGLKASLENDSVRYVVLKNKVPFHTPLLEPSLEPLKSKLAEISYNALTTPVLSNLSGSWGDGVMEKADYWLQQVTSPVLFSRNMSILSESSDSILVEVGPGQILSGLYKANSPHNENIIAPLLPGKSEIDNKADFQAALGTIWSSGVDIDWQRAFDWKKRNIVHLPPYPFKKNRYRIDHYSKVDRNTEKLNSASAAKEILNVSSKGKKIEIEKDFLDIISEAWREVLGYAEIDIHADFYSLGGDSMLASRVAAFISNALAVSVQPVDIIVNPTIAELDSVIRQKIAKTVVSTRQENTDTIKRDSMQEVPLPAAPKRLWFIHEFEPEHSGFNLAQSIRINRLVDFDIFEKVIQKIIKRHDVFNVNIINKSGIPFFTTIELPKKKLEYINLTNSLNPESEFTHIVRNVCSSPIPLNDGPCYQMVLYHLGAQDFRFVLYIPHMLTDGWSFDIIQKEVEKIYTDLEQGRDTLADIPETGYLNYISENSYSPAELNTGSIDFWKKYFGQEEYILQLPANNQRPKKMKFTGRMEYFSLPPEVSQKLKTLSASESVSVFHVLLAVYSFVLHKYSGQKEVVIGIPDANRNSSTARELVGFFLNMVPVKITYDPSIPATSVFRNIRTSYAECLKHSNIGFENIIDVLDIPRHENIHPLFQTMFAFQNYMDNESSNGKFVQEIYDRGISEYDISLYMWQRNGQFSGAFEYSDELFTQETISRFIKAFLITAESFIFNPSLAVSETSLLDSVDRDELLHRVNNTEVENNGHFLEYFLESVKRFPSEIAVSFEGDSLSYKDLDELSTKTALYLSSSGVKQRSLVGIYLNRGIEMLVSILAVMKTGAAYVPLDPHFPDDRIALMLEDSSLAHVISSSDISTNIVATDLEIINLDKVEKDIHAIELNPLSVDINPEDRAYVLYTSGSTGVPNGVQILHRALINFLVSMSKEPGLDQKDKVLGLTTLSFDISGLELLLPLILGASVEIVSYETAIDAYALIHAIEVEDISVVQATPATWQMMFDVGWSGKPGLKVLCGGEALSKELSAKLLDSGMDLWNMYGPTETTIWSSVYHMSREHNKPLIGHPIDNTTFYVLDNERNLVPVGVAGELYIGGAGVSSGYLNRPELNAKRFVKDPFSRNDGALMYKTGDRVVYAGNGNFRYLERIDSQVKIRGFRIELGDIESVANQHPDVIESVCIVKSISDNDKRLVLYVRSSELTEKELLLDFMRIHLPAYMVPSYVQIMDKFPLTPNGKVNRRMLPEINTSETDKEVVVSPRSQDEWVAVAIWKKVLGIENLGISDNFFSLGGHSLLATQLVYEMNKSFNKNWQLRDLFNKPTIDEFLAQDVKIDTDNIPLVFPVNRIRDGIPFFLVAGVYDEMYYTKNSTSAYEEDFLRYFNNIIVHLEMKTPLYGIRPRGIYMGESFKRNVAEMARENIRAIKRMYPEGPYILGGECLGGVVAFEMARQLLDAGEQVDLLILSDTYKTNFRFMLQYKLIAYRRFLIKIIRKTIRGFYKPTEWKKALKYTPVLFPVTRKNRESRRLIIGSYLYANKLIKYRPENLKCHTLLLINEEWNKKYSNLNWTSHELPNVDIRVLPGNHNTKLSTYGNITGKVISDYIAK